LIKNSNPFRLGISKYLGWTTFPQQKQLMTNTFKPLISDESGILSNLEQRAKKVMNLTTKVRNALTGPERHHVLAAAYHEDTLIITTDSAAWTAQIRFAQDDLRKHLSGLGEKTFIHLKVRVGNARDAG